MSHNDFRRFVHEAGHAVVAVAVSRDPVFIEDGPAITDEGLNADAICTATWCQGAEETRAELFTRRIAVIYGAAFAEASVECSGQLEQRAQSLFVNDASFSGDRQKVESVSVQEMAQAGFDADQRHEIRISAWEWAKSIINEQKQTVTALAHAIDAQRVLSNEQIRDLCGPDAGARNEIESGGETSRRTRATAHPSEDLA